MKRQYNGLEAMKIQLDNTNVIATSGTCVAMVQLKMEGTVCVSPWYQQQVEYVGDQG